MTGRARTGWLALLAGIAGAALYLPVLGYSWIFDDAFHLRFIRAHEVTEYFTRPSVWQELPFRMFTPLQLLSYELDLRLAGLDPRAFYLHQLYAFALLGALLFLAMRSWWADEVALVATLLCLFGIPLKGWIALLMSRHYIEGFLAATVSLIAFVAWARSGRRWLLASSAVGFFVSVLAKEVFLPLPLVLLVLPERSWRDRARGAVPHLLVALVYLGWRRVMLDTWLGGYGWSFTAGEIPAALARFPHRTWDLLIGEGGAAAVIVTAVLILLALASVTDRRAAVRLGAVFVAWLIPLLPVLKAPEDRHVVLLWILIVAGAAATLVRRFPPSRAVLILAALALPALIGNRLDWDAADDRFRRMSGESDWLLSHPSEAMLRGPANPPATVGQLAELRKDLGGSALISWFYDDLYLCEHGESGVPVWESGPYGRVERVSRDRFAEIRDEHCERRIRGNAPLWAEFSLVRGTLRWKFGPYRNRGEYAILFPDAVAEYELPASEGFQVGSQTEFRLRVRYRDPEGWVTYSPLLELDFERDPGLKWERR